jgi:hypothetical protein
VTGLVWQRNVDPGRRHWADAKSYCEGLTLAGNTDWRLPSRIELVSITRLDRTDAPVDPVAFPSTPQTKFWTGSPQSGAVDRHWYVYFGTGDVIIDATSDTNLFMAVRCVRGATTSTPPPARYSVGGTTVTDLKTTLVWQRTAGSTARTWNDAGLYCSGLTAPGGLGMRLPSVGELQSIVDEARAGDQNDPAIDASTFLGHSTGFPQCYWTASNAQTSQSSTAWWVDSRSGLSRSRPQADLCFVRCVQ